MTYQIIHISDYALSLLSGKPPLHIHSIYRRTINLQLAGNILALQSEGSVLSPVSLITELDQQAMAQLPVLSSPAVSVGDGYIEFHTCPNLRFCWEKAKIHNVHLQSGSPEFFCCTQQIRQALNLSDGSGFSALFLPCQSQHDPEDPVLLYAQNTLKSCQAFMYRGDYLLAAQTLGKVLGLGIGLTPSGDDFLCGVLASFILTASQGKPFARALSQEIREHLHNTNEISRTFLSCALKGMFSVPVNQISRYTSPSEMLADFREIGHSSGLDTLSGILYGMILMDR